MSALHGLIANVLVSCAASSGATEPFRSTPPAPRVLVPELGVIEGKVSTESNQIAFFKGIPYAQPPINQLRWQPPVLRNEQLGNESSPFLATEFGAECMQHLNGATVVGNEDCLYLNVAAPVSVLNQSSSAKRLPVLLWIHGGAYMTGSSSAPVWNVIDIYANDAFIKAAGDVVVVSINYRLNVFGFLGGGPVATRTTDNSQGNFGIQDQRLAMEWTKQFIGAFGGDGSNVTIFGESAGGNSVINHLAQQASFGLYAKAIVESGAYSWGADTVAKKAVQLSTVLRGSSCTTFECLVSLDKDLVLNASKHAGGFFPTVDGVSLSATPIELIRTGKYNNKVPVIIGSNRDEQVNNFSLPLPPPPALRAT